MTTKYHKICEETHQQIQEEYENKELDYLLKTVKNTIKAGEYLLSASLIVDIGNLYIKENKKEAKMTIWGYTLLEMQAMMYRMAGEQQFEWGNKWKAFHFAKMAHRLQPKSYKETVFLAKCYTTIGQYQFGIKYARQALKQKIKK